MLHSIGTLFYIQIISHTTLEHTIPTHRRCTSTTVHSTLFISGLLFMITFVDSFAFDMRWCRSRWWGRSGAKFHFVHQCRCRWLFVPDPTWVITFRSCDLPFRFLDKGASFILVSLSSPFHTLHSHDLFLIPVCQESWALYPASGVPALHHILICLWCICWVWDPRLRFFLLRISCGFCSCTGFFSPGTITVPLSTYVTLHVHWVFFFSLLFPALPGHMYLLVFSYRFCIISLYLLSYAVYFSGSWFAYCIYLYTALSKHHNAVVYSFLQIWWFHSFQTVPFDCSHSFIPFLAIHSIPFHLLLTLMIPFNRRFTIHSLIPRLRFDLLIPFVVLGWYVVIPICYKFRWYVSSICWNSLSMLLTVPFLIWLPHHILILIQLLPGRISLLFTWFHSLTKKCSVC